MYTLILLANIFLAHGSTDIFSSSNGSPVSSIWDSPEESEVPLRTFATRHQQISQTSQEITVEPSSVVSSELIYRPTDRTESLYLALSSDLLMSSSEHIFPSTFSADAMTDTTALTKTLKNPMDTRVTPLSEETTDIMESTSRDSMSIIPASTNVMTDATALAKTLINTRITRVPSLTEEAADQVESSSKAGMTNIPASLLTLSVMTHNSINTDYSVTPEFNQPELSSSDIITTSSSLAAAEIIISKTLSQKQTLSDNSLNINLSNSLSASHGDPLVISTMQLKSRYQTFPINDGNSQNLNISHNIDSKGIVYGKTTTASTNTVIHNRESIRSTKSVDVNRNVNINSVSSTNNIPSVNPSSTASSSHYPSDSEIFSDTELQDGWQTSPKSLFQSTYSYHDISIPYSQSTPQMRISAEESKISSYEFQIKAISTAPPNTHGYTTAIDHHSTIQTLTKENLIDKSTVNASKTITDTLFSSSAPEQIISGSETEVHVLTSILPTLSTLPRLPLSSQEIAIVESSTSRHLPPISSNATEIAITATETTLPSIVVEPLPSTLSNFEPEETHSLYKISSLHRFLSETTKEVPIIGTPLPQSPLPVTSLTYTSDSFIIVTPSSAVIQTDQDMMLQATGAFNISQETTEAVSSMYFTSNSNISASIISKSLTTRYTKLINEPTMPAIPTTEIPLPTQTMLNLSVNQENSLFFTHDTSEASFVSKPINMPESRRSLSTEIKEDIIEGTTMSSNSALYPVVSRTMTLHTDILSVSYLSETSNEILNKESTADEVKLSSHLSLLSSSKQTFETMVIAPSKTQLPDKYSTPDTMSTKSSLISQEIFPTHSKFTHIPPVASPPLSSSVSLTSVGTSLTSPLILAYSSTTIPTSSSLLLPDVSSSNIPVNSSSSPTIATLQSDSVIFSELPNTNETSIVPSIPLTTSWSKSLTLFSISTPALPMPYLSSFSDKEISLVTASSPVSFTLPDISSVFMQLPNASSPPSLSEPASTSLSASSPQGVLSTSPLVSLLYINISSTDTSLILLSSSSTSVALPYTFLSSVPTLSPSTVSQGSSSPSSLSDKLSVLSVIISQNVSLSSSGEDTSSVSSQLLLQSTSSLSLENMASESSSLMYEPSRYYVSSINDSIILSVTPLMQSIQQATYISVSTNESVFPSMSLTTNGAMTPPSTVSEEMELSMPFTTDNTMTPSLTINESLESSVSLTTYAILTQPTSLIVSPVSSLSLTIAEKLTPYISANYSSVSSVAILTTVQSISLTSHAILPLSLSTNNLLVPSMTSISDYSTEYFVLAPNGTSSPSGQGNDESVFTSLIQTPNVIMTTPVSTNVSTLLAVPVTSKIISTSLTSTASQSILETANQSLLQSTTIEVSSLTTEIMTTKIISSYTTMQPLPLPTNSLVITSMSSNESTVVPLPTRTMPIQSYGLSPSVASTTPFTLLSLSEYQSLDTSQGNTSVFSPEATTTLPHSLNSKSESSVPSSVVTMSTSIEGVGGASFLSHVSYLSSLTTTSSEMTTTVNMPISVTEVSLSISSESSLSPSSEDVVPMPTTLIITTGYVIKGSSATSIQDTRIVQTDSRTFVSSTIVTTVYHKPTPSLRQPSMSMQDSKTPSTYIQQSPPLVVNTETISPTESLISEESISRSQALPTENNITQTVPESRPSGLSEQAIAIICGVISTVALLVVVIVIILCVIKRRNQRLKYHKDPIIHQRQFSLTPVDTFAEDHDIPDTTLEMETPIDHMNTNAAYEDGMSTFGKSKKASGPDLHAPVSVSVNNGLTHSDPPPPPPDSGGDGSGQGLDLIDFSDDQLPMSNLETLWGDNDFNFGNTDGKNAKQGEVYV